MAVIPNVSDNQTIATVWGNTVANTVNKLPLGFVAIHQLTSLFIISANHTVRQDTGLSITIDEPANRRWKVTHQANPYVSSGTPAAIYAILRNGIIQHEATVPGTALDPNTSNGFCYVHYHLTGAGALGVVWKTQMSTNIATNVADFGSATFPRILLIEDVGGV